MKIKVNAKEFKSAIKAAQTLQKLAPDTKLPEDEGSGFKGCLTAADKGMLIDTGVMGAYVQLSLKATTMREGVVGIDLNTVDKLRMSGDVVVELDPVTNIICFASGKTKYDCPADQSAIESVRDTKPTDIETPIIARIPAGVLAKATAMTSIKPALKVEDMRMQFSLKNGMFELVGLDNFSYAKYTIKDDSIKVKGTHTFVVRAASLKTILNSIKSSTVEIGVERVEGTEDVKSVRFKAPDADVFYPTLDMPIVSTDAIREEICAGKMDCAFSTVRKNIRDAIADVKAIGTDTSVTLVLTIRVTPQDVKMAADNNGSVAVVKIPSDAQKTCDGKPQVMHLNQSYLDSIFALAPESVPMRIEAWNKTSVLIKATKTENWTVEYFMSQVDLEALNLEENSGN